MQQRTNKKKWFNVRSKTSQAPIVINSRPGYTQTFSRIEKAGSGVRRRSFHYIKGLNSSVQHSGWKDHDVTNNSYWKESALLNGEDEHVECSKEMNIFNSTFTFSHYNMAAAKNVCNFLLISSISRPNLLCFGFDLNQSQRTKPISRNGYGPD